jgi:hypothetical protein
MGDGSEVFLRVFCGEAFLGGLGVLAVQFLKDFSWRSYMDAPRLASDFLDGDRVAWAAVLYSASSCRLDL